MTVSYSASFWRLLCRWRGSLWKTIWKDLVVFIICYYTMRLIYKQGIVGSRGQETFERLIIMFDKFTIQIPLVFMLGFYVMLVVKRWWDQFQRISFPETFLYWVSAYIKGNDAETRLIRRTMARYCVLSQVLGWRSISTRVHKRFPTLQHIVKLGLMTEEERTMYESIKIQFDPHKQWFVPTNWILSLLTRCYDENKICHVNELSQLISELQKYRMGFMELFIYDWITIPLVYTQMAIVATYGYFSLCLIGRQFIDHNTAIVKKEGYDVDMIVPVFTILQFLFYVGWLKVGEDLMVSGDECYIGFFLTTGFAGATRFRSVKGILIKLNYIIDRNFEIAYAIVDRLHGQVPKMQETSANFGMQTLALPHTRASIEILELKPSSHLKKTKLTKEEMETVVGPGSLNLKNESVLAEFMTRVHAAQGHIHGDDAATANERFFYKSVQNLIKHRESDDTQNFARHRQSDAKTTNPMFL